MGGILLLSGFELSGLVLARCLFNQRGAVVRIWLGMCLGLIMMMWFPALIAFITGFTALAQYIALAAAVMLAVAAAPRIRKAPRIPSEDKKTELPLTLLMALVIPFAILGVYLQYTHTLRDVNGALHVGQSTFGDLCLHLGIASSLRDASFPPAYSLIRGVLLGYPFLSDSMVTSMLLTGSDMAISFVVTGSIMMILVFTGFALFAWELTHNKLAVVFAFLMMFINGGLGFIYVLDGAAGDSSMLREVFTGYYRTPTNMPALNLRWVNVICDMMVPQRTLLAGWTVLLPALFLLVNAARENKRRLFIVLGIWAGVMPMIHTHSFLALGIMSAGVMIYTVIHSEERLKTTKNFLIYALIALVLALPQLITWSFPQTVNGGSLGIRFNWVNNNGDNTFIDGYFWFWIKNVGVVYLLAVPAALKMKGTGRALALGALMIYVVAELIQFQPNPYDNNKLFYVSYIVITPMVGKYLVKLIKRLKGMRIASGFACAVMLLATLSGGLSIGREVISDYRLFSSDEAAAGRYADENTPKDAVFLTGDHHNNPIAALAGRQIICGTGSYLYFHGINYRDEQSNMRKMLEDPADNRALMDEYSVEYVYISSYERGSFDVDEAWFADNCTAVFTSGDVTIYKLT